MAEFLSPSKTRKFKDKRERHQHNIYKYRTMKNEWKKGERIFLLFFHGMNSTTPAFWVSRISSLPSPSQQLHPSERTKRDMRMKDTGNPAQPLSDLLCHHHCVLLLVYCTYLLLCFFTSLRSFSTASRFIALKGETIKSRGPTKSWTARGRNHSPFFFCCFVLFQVFWLFPKDRRRKTAGLFRVSSVGRPPPQRAVALYSVAVV